MREATGTKYSHTDGTDKAHRLLPHAITSASHIRVEGSSNKLFQLYRG